MNHLVKFAVIPSLALVASIGIARADDDGDKPDRDREHHRGDGEKVEAIFNKLDENGDGKIGPKELAASPRLEDKDRQEIGEIFKKRDLNGDGGITLNEFKKSFADHHRPKGKKGDGKRKGDGKGDGKRKGKGGKGGN